MTLSYVIGRLVGNSVSRAEANFHFPGPRLF